MNINHIQVVRLADVKDDQPVVITKVKGHGAFRKRITEMGFVTGTEVKLIKYAPLKDPVEYELMGYRVSLRRSEANLIEVVKADDSFPVSGHEFQGTVISDKLKISARKQSQNINVALVGNPNCGKTTLFNYATGRHEKVGNYGGVTVDMKSAHINHNGYTINITDLPGTYSISEYTPEELFVRNHLANDPPDIVINVIDASNLERNLFLTTQLIDMNIKVVVALNMFDELEARGDQFDYDMLGKMLGIPFVPTVGSKGLGINHLLNEIIDVYEDRNQLVRHVHVNYGHIIGQSIGLIKDAIKKHQPLTDAFYPRYAASKLLEGDKVFRAQFALLPDSGPVIEIANKESAALEREYGEKAETIIADAKYGFIRGALRETYVKVSEQNDISGYRIDRFLTHKWLGIPIFIFFMWAMFQTTFSLGSYPMDWIDSGVSWLSDVISNIMPPGILHDLLIDGIIGGVGGVIVFLPNILILFFCISLMEDTGYMARAAFIMDRLMHKIGLHGKSFIPLLMGFGCNVPAVMATRTLENRKDRILTMLIIPFMSCSARLPVYILLISAFFPVHQGLVMLSIYFIGIFLAALVALVFKMTFFAKKEVPFVMELPPYRIPTVRNTTIHMWNKSVQYITKMGTIILMASILIWALGYYPIHVNFSKDYKAEIQKVETETTLTPEQKIMAIQELNSAKHAEKLEQSYIGLIGHAIEPVIRPLGFDWKIGISIVTGLAAKEIVVGTMGVLYQSGENEDSNIGLQTKLQEQVFNHGDKKGQKVFTPLTAFGLMVFVLIYFPCVAVIAAIKRESNWRWAVFTMIYTTILAWFASFFVYQIGSLFI